ncbi:putative membrane protein [Sedimentibacter acidaminivorans]|uniref:Membrane protein n=1 Tax=Sedimentibacter acidaminivorans TaxID=913099 RepID=A0ABS4GDQ6_9FIRM|nr:DUF2975 domain-containing protein [Sedimentibacter acidaminivorans]MBP1925500.1 putative membrane protein [Sedimentibacter acidaminivorans]
MYKKSIVHYITKICVDVLFYIGILCCVLVPFSSSWLIKYFYFAEENITFMIVVLLLSGGASVYILWELKVIFKTLLVGNPFILKNVESLRKIALASAFISIIYLIKCLFSFTIATVVIIIMFVIASLFCLTIKDLFKQAINYKDENDLTI